MGTTITYLDIDLKMKNSRVKYLESERVLESTFKIHSS